MPTPLWNLKPQHSFRIKATHAPVLKTKLEGNRVLRRRKPGLVATRVREIHQWTYAQYDEAYELWLVHGEHTPLTKYTYLDDVPHADIDLWYFVGEFEVDYKMIDYYVATVDFERKL